MATNTVERELLNVKEAGQMLGLGKTKMYEWAEQNGPGVIRIGRAVRFSKAALKAWIEDAASTSHKNGGATPGSVAPLEVGHATDRTAAGRS